MKIHTMELPTQTAIHGNLAGPPFFLPLPSLTEAPPPTVEDVEQEVEAHGGDLRGGSRVTLVTLRITLQVTLV